MKKFIITEEDKQSILEKYFPKLIQEQKQFLSKIFGGSVDDLFKMYSDDVVKSLDDVFAKILTKQANTISKSGQLFVKSASGMEIPMKTIKDAIELVAQGKLQPDRIATLLPRNLADGSEFRNIVTSALETRGAKTVASQSAGRALSQFESKHLLEKCHSNALCDVRNILNSFYQKLSGSAKLSQFNPSKVKILERSTVSGREVINVSLEDGSQVLFYKSSGANVASTGKQAGEWFVIPGFADNGWFFKTADTVELTKGGNKYLTDMAKFLEQNGSGALGK